MFPADLGKLSHVVKNDVFEKIEYDWFKKLTFSGY